MNPPGALGTLVDFDGWVANPNWFAPGEGPFTVIAKLALTNVVNAQQICRRFGRRVTLWRAAAVHGRSLLAPLWLRGEASGPRLAIELGKRSLVAISERWCHAIACDRALRYCPTCLSAGYQSVLCQIDGLMVCPTHGDPLVAHCLGCGEPTPPYAITPEGFDRPMVCRHCDAPFAPIWESAAHSGAWHAVKDEAGYLKLRSWLARADSLDVQWSDQVSWLSDPPATPTATAHKRVCTAGALTALLPAPVPLGHDRLRSMSLPLLSDRPQFESRSDGFARGRMNIYKAIRRHYAHHFRVPISAAVSDDSNRLVWRNDFAMMMPTRPATDSRRHGFCAWRLRFEETFGKRVGLELRSDLLLWPVDWSASDRAWGHFAHQCLLLDLAMARGLNRAMAGLDGERDEDRAAWLEVVGEWHRRFGAFSRAWPDGLTVLRRRTPSQFDQAYLIAVESAVCIHEH